jgi:hypothetical protein
MEIFVIIQLKIVIIPVTVKNNFKVSFYKTIVPNILYRYEMWPITLKEEHKLQVSETA